MLNNQPLKTLLDLKSDSVNTLNASYVLTNQHIGAIQAAFLSNRPLLVRGDPGLGKSQLAYAIASILCSGQLFSYHPVGGFYHLNAFSTSAGVA